MNPKEKRHKRLIRHKRVRAIVKGTAERPRFSVFRSSNHIYAQLINDAEGSTLLSADDKKEVRSKKLEVKSKDKDKDLTGKKANAFRVGESLAKKAIDIGISSVIFDRNGYKYHGRIKALAEGARKGGLKF